MGVLGVGGGVQGISDPPPFCQQMACFQGIWGPFLPKDPVSRQITVLRVICRLWLRDKGQKFVLTTLDFQQSNDPELRVSGRSA